MFTIFILELHNRVSNDKEQFRSNLIKHLFTCIAFSTQHTFPRLLFASRFLSAMFWFWLLVLTWSSSCCDCIEDILWCSYFDELVQICKHWELVKSFLFKLKLAIEADHRAQKVSQCKHFLIVRSVILFRLQTFEIEEYYVHLSFVVASYRLTPKPDSLCTSFRLLSSSLRILIACSVLVIDFELWSIIRKE